MLYRHYEKAAIKEYKKSIVHTNKKYKFSMIFCSVMGLCGIFGGQLAGIAVITLMTIALYLFIDKSRWTDEDEHLRTRMSRCSEKKKYIRKTLPEKIRDYLKDKSFLIVSDYDVASVMTVEDATVFLDVIQDAIINSISFYEEVDGHSYSKASHEEVLNDKDLPNVLSRQYANDYEETVRRCIYKARKLLQESPNNLVSLDLDYDEEYSTPYEKRDVWYYEINCGDGSI